MESHFLSAFRVRNFVCTKALPKECCSLGKIFWFLYTIAIININILFVNRYWNNNGTDFGYTQFISNLKIVYIHIGICEHQRRYRNPVFFSQFVQRIALFNDMYETNAASEIFCHEPAPL